MKEPKQKPCPICAEMFTPKRWGLRLTRCCSNAACVRDYAERVREIEREKEARKQKTEFIINDKPRQLKLCQKTFNKLRRLQELKWFIDQGIEPFCISCGNKKGNDEWCAGHFKTVGAQSGLRFDPMNVYLQHNRRCNSQLSGDIYGTKTTHGYINGLKIRFGEEKATEIIEHCNQKTEVKKWTCDELIAMRKDWNNQIKELESFFKSCH